MRVLLACCTVSLIALATGFRDEAPDGVDSCARSLGVSAILYINLEKRKDRLKEIVEELSEMLGCAHGDESVQRVPICGTLFLEHSDEKEKQMQLNTTID